jgi:hypothetical protein
VRTKTKTRSQRKTRRRRRLIEKDGAALASVIVPVKNERKEKGRWKTKIGVQFVVDEGAKGGYHHLGGRWGRKGSEDHPVDTSLDSVHVATRLYTSDFTFSNCVFDQSRV